MVSCICGAGNAVSICSNFKVPLYTTFCFDIVDYNKTGYLTNEQFIDLKTKSTPLIEQKIKIFNTEYKLAFILCFKGTNHFISYLYDYPHNFKLLKKNFTYLYNDINNGYLEEVLNFNIKNLPDDEAPFMVIYIQV